MQNLILASTLLLASAAPAATPPPRDCIECSMEKGRVSLCPPHRNEEASVLREAKKGFASKSTLARRDAMKAAAQLTDAHANAPSPKVASLLCEGLTDESMKVRELALGHLLEGQHPETTVRGLLEATDDMLDRWKELHRDAVKYLAAQAKGKPIDTLEMESMKVYVEVPATCSQLLAAMGRTNDDRCAAKLVKVLEAEFDELPGPFFVAAAGAAIELGSAQSVEAVAEFLARLGEALENGKIEPLYPESQVMTLGRAALTLPAPAASSIDFYAVAHTLEAAAKDRGLDTGPGWNLAEAEAWESWFEANADTFPVKLGRCDAPVRGGIPKPLASSVFEEDQDD